MKAGRAPARVRASEGGEGRAGRALARARAGKGSAGRARAGRAPAKGSASESGEGRAGRMPVRARASEGPDCTVWTAVWEPQTVQSGLFISVRGFRPPYPVRAR